MLARVPLQKKSAADFVIEIRASWQKSVAAIIETGRLLIEAKKQLPHGQWCSMFSSRFVKGDDLLPFGERTGQKLMAIANHPFMSNPTHVSVLPPSYGTLYELSSLDAAELERMVRSDDINPEMQRKDVKALGFYQYSGVPRALDLLVHFMGQLPPEELAAQVAWQWTALQIDCAQHERKMPKLHEYVRELVEACEVQLTKTDQETERFIQKVKRSRTVEAAGTSMRSKPDERITNAK